MHKVLTGLFSAAALVALAACGEADNTTTQGVEPEVVEEEEPATDDTTTQGLEPDTEEVQ